MTTDAWGHAPFPRAALVGAAVVIAGTLALVVFTRLQNPAPIRDDSAEIAGRDLRFADLADGGIAVRDADTGRQVGLVAPATGGFLRATMRGLATARRLAGADDALPFRLAAHVDGGLTLDDPVTHRQLELVAFGPTNAQAFARFLPLTLAPAPAPVAP